ncbi:MAG TPA: thioredoxin-like domain-containing protein [bacterium]|jgi:thiol-disulfide isomerase/thioredoxin
MNKLVLFTIVLIAVLVGALWVIKGSLNSFAGTIKPVQISEAESDEAGEMTFQIETYGHAPELDGAVSWLNIDHPLRLSELSGKIVLLDFWTYGCINCMHIIPDLEYLEQKYVNELVIIGVHSAKFENENDSENIRQAILRYNIHHPVANDADFNIWRRYTARAWPTLVLIDPEGMIVGMMSGEGHRNELDQAIEALIAIHRQKGTLDTTPVEFALEADEVPDSFLRYPGKIEVQPEINRIFISDSNNNRIVISDLDGNVLDIAGNGDVGFDGGSFDTATFSRPQGMAYKDGILYVADTDNHAIRALDLENRNVQTFGGNAIQGNSITMTGGPDTALSSPWDLAMDGDTMYIAMAGTHQLWSVDLNTRDFQPFAGNRHENIIDGKRLDAQLSQPSGITAGDDGYIYFADSEASAIRRAGKGPDGEVETLVGEGLFEFGDVDGTGADVRLQHPLGVEYYNGIVYFADTYNHKIKTLDPSTKTVKTFLGTGEPGGGNLLSEPSGLAIYNNELYIADTNNHRIVIADLDTMESRTLNLKLDPDMASELDSAVVSSGIVNVHFSIRLPDGFKLNELAPYSVEFSGSGGVSVDEKITEHLKEFNVPVSVESNGELMVSIQANYCSLTNEAICGIYLDTLKIPFTVSEPGSDSYEIAVEVTR